MLDKERDDPLERLGPGVLSNLRQETERFVALCGKSPEDVAWCACGEGALGYEELLEAADFRYDPGWGRVRVEPGLAVAFRDGSWMERWSYDGKEGWAYRRPPERPAARVAAPLDLEVRP